MEDGLWNQLEKGKNKHVYKTLSKDEILEAITEVSKKIPKQNLGVMSDRAFAASMAMMTKVAEKEAEDRLRKLIFDILEELYLKGKINAEQHAKIETLLESNDGENILLAKAIMESKGNGKIVKEDKFDYATGIAKTTFKFVYN